MEEIKINCRWTSQPLEVLKHCTGEHLAHIKSNIWCFLLCTGTGWKAKYTTPDYIYYVLHVPLTCSTCSSCMFYMFLLHVQHVQRSCSTCTFYMFSMFKVHVQHVQRTCSACTFCLFKLQYVILHLHSELQWAITHSNLHRFTRFLFIWVRFIET